MTLILLMFLVVTFCINAFKNRRGLTNMALSPTNLGTLSAAETTTADTIEGKIDIALAEQFNPGETLFVYQVASTESNETTNNVVAEIMSRYTTAGWSSVQFQEVANAKYFVFSA